jgi:hypothetical protein
MKIDATVLELFLAHGEANGFGECMWALGRIAKAA